MCADSGLDEAFPEKMTPEASRDEASAKAACPLSVRQQNRNLVLFGINKSLTFLAGPVMYIGNLDAILLNKLDYSDKVANLPATAGACTAAPLLVLFTWYFCRVRMLKPVLVISYVVITTSGLIATVGLLQPQSNWLVAALIVRAMLIGWCMSIVNVYEWEILARGVAEQRRGLALSFAYGFGPILAAVSSLGAQLILDGKLGPISMGKLSFPWDFTTLYLISVVIMGLPAILAMCYIVPTPPVEIVRERLVSGVFGGMGDFLKNRLLMLTSIALLLVILGSSGILPSVVLYLREVIGEEPQTYTGYLFALRFSFKAMTGLVLGWILVRTHPRLGLLATTFLGLAGLVWALLVPEKWYLLSFGMLGAGELYGIYYQNYLISCSPTSMVRRNLAYASLLALPVTFGPVMFGLISDNYGLRCSIKVAAVLLASTVLLVQFALPRWPSVPSSD